jgi:uncharacterized OsmC-like protein
VFRELWRQDGVKPLFPKRYGPIRSRNLAGCVTTTTVLHAAARGIRIHRLATELTGDIDLQGFLALDDSVPVGYESIRIRMDIEADATDEEIDRLLAFAREHSPVCSTVCRPVPVTVERVTRDVSQLAEGHHAVA